MGLMLAVGAVARAAGPFLAIATLESSLRVCFGVAAALVLFGQILMGVFWKNCGRHVYFKTHFS